MTQTSDMMPLEMTWVEDAIIKIWSEVLQRTELKPEDGFASLGGDSLSAMRVLFQVHERFGLELSLADFFEADTIRNVALLVSRLLSGQRIGPSPDAVSADEGFI